MKKHLSAILGCFSLVALTHKDSTAQITQLKNYKNYSSAAIGTFKGVNFREAGFSGIYPIPNTNGAEFWVCSDRGVNIDAANANIAGCRPTYDKIYAFPNYAPKIHRVRVKGDSIQILQTISMKRPNGTGATGIINPTGLGSTANEVPSTDTVQDCANFNAKTTAKDIWGVDPEGIIVDKQGFFWICEEGGPTIWKLNRNGVVVKRFTPYDLSLGQPQDVKIDSVFKYRKNNRGFEGIAMTPNGKIYAIIQSPILYPTQAVGENTRIHRILEIDPATNATRMFAYVNDGIIGTGANQIRLRDWKIGDMAAINDTSFLVIEAALRGTTDVKRVYQISINGATNVHSGLYGGSTLEALVDEAGLTANNITPVKKTLVMDMLANGWPAVLDKAEGLAILNDSTIVIGNDNDYGQSSPTENGMPTATTNLSNIFVYRLSGNNKLKNFVPVGSSLYEGVTGISSSQSPYLVPEVPGAKFTSIITAGDAVNNYRMVGLPDGMGAFDNGNGTFTVLLNHEVGNGGGVTRAHGQKGTFVSKWIINKSDLSVVSGEDLIKTVNLWNKATNSYVAYNSAFTSPLADMGRFCSADLAEPTAYFNSKTGMGSTARIFMNGEETGAEGRGFAHIATGADAGVSYELPALGKFSWENSVASPAESDTTVVIGLDDATPGQIYVYVGKKTNTGNEVEKAGLTNGRLYGVAVNGLLAETSASVPAPNTIFSLVDLGDVRNKTGATINTESNNGGVTQFLRPEDGAWDPSNPNDFYFVTTNSFASPSRMWRLRFTDPRKPMMGGTIEAVLDGTEGPKMMDNIGIDKYGHVLIVEDVGNNVHNGKVWQYDIATDVLTLVGSHDTTRFIAGAANFLTQDEEASGIIDAQEILGPGMFLTVDQAHYGIAGELVEGGQMLAFYNPLTAATSPEINITGNNLTIVDGAVTTEVTNNTDMGSVNVGNNTTKQFVIENKGAGALKVTGISMEGANASEFTLVNAPNFPLSIASNATQTITVQFTPTAGGARTATVNVMNNDADEATYSFAVKGTGILNPDINVTGNNVNIINGDLTPGTANHTDFGVVRQNNTATKKYTIENKGQGKLTVSGITMTGANASDFSLVSAPNFPLDIATAATQEITVQFAAGNAVGTRSATVQIASNDADEATYEFGIQGMVPDPQSVANLSTNAFNLYPNPTGNEATISMMLAKDEHVVVTVYNVKGQEVMREAKELKQGAQQMILNTTDLKNGAYFIQVSAGTQSAKLKMVVVH
jgi:hypothetical protein